MPADFFGSRLSFSCARKDTCKGGFAQTAKIVKLQNETHNPHATMRLRNSRQAMAL
jgi:hypothetical protein